MSILDKNLDVQANFGSLCQTISARVSLQPINLTMSEYAFVQEQAKKASKKLTELICNLNKPKPSAIDIKRCILYVCPGTKPSNFAIRRHGKLKYLKGAHLEMYFDIAILPEGARLESKHNLNHLILDGEHLELIANYGGLKCKVFSINVDIILNATAPYNDYMF